MTAIARRGRGGGEGDSGRKSKDTKKESLNREGGKRGHKGLREGQA